VPSPLQGWDDDRAFSVSRLIFPLAKTVETDNLMPVKGQNKNALPYIPKGTNPMKTRILTLAAAALLTFAVPVFSPAAAFADDTGVQAAPATDAEQAQPATEDDQAQTAPADDEQAAPATDAEQQSGDDGSDDTTGGDETDQ